MSIALVLVGGYASFVVFAYWGFGQVKEMYLVDGVPTVRIINPALSFWHRIREAVLGPFVFGLVLCHRGWSDEPCPEPVWHRH